MKIVGEKTKILSMISALQIRKGKDSVVKEYDEKGFPILLDEKRIRADNAEADIMAVLAEYRKEYFIEYKVKAIEELVFTTSLWEVISGLFRSDIVTLETTDDEILVTGENGENYSEPLCEWWNNPVPQAIPMKALPETGRTTDSDQPSLLISVADLDNLTTDDRILFTVKDGKLSVSRRVNNDQSVYTRPIEAAKILQERDVKASFQGEYFFAMLRAFSDKVWLSLHENALTLSVVEKDYSLSYLLAPFKEYDYQADAEQEAPKPETVEQEATEE